MKPLFRIFRGSLHVWKELCQEGNRIGLFALLMPALVAGFGGSLFHWLAGVLCFVSTAFIYSAWVFYADDI